MISPLLLFPRCSFEGVSCVRVVGALGTHSKLSGSVWISMKRVCRDVRTAKKQPIVRVALLWFGEGY